MRPRRLKLGTHVDSGQMYCVYRNQAAAAYWSLYFFNFLSLQFSNIKIVRTVLSGTVMPRRLKLRTYVDSGWMYDAYQYLTAAAYSFLYFFFLQYSNIKVFVTLYSGTVRPRKLKLGEHMDNGWMYHVYQNQAAAAAYLFLYFFHFSFSNFQTLKCFCHTFLRNCEA